MENADIKVSDELKRDISPNQSLSNNNINTIDSNVNATTVNTNLNTNTVNNDELLGRAVWITRLADDNLSLSYSTQELLSSGHSLVEVLDIQVCELIKKYVDEKQILAVAGSLDIVNLNDKTKDILLRLASIDTFKNSNNSYGLMTFNKGNTREALNLRNTNNTIKDYKDLRQAMLNEWMQIRQDFYNVKL
ncbi:DUF1357 family protein [Borrelia hermsii]|uniref:Uncharacterized protein n=2 Tax=Borrelia hermsii TaxID=140 RepID=T1ECC1_BORHE|nr:DUF1357 family protein [Borrelia hermsii]ADN26353.1 hypothetical protein BHA097 [Borrelia hermsii]AMR75929.1 hypothetical protein A0V01_04780 [Borrelia hermsii]ANA43738.1 hypothetical protein AXX13_A0470 [Borrelia hermsii HS1]UPA08527.1 DUF1357 family protein [Borrelia hermsii DAH]